MFARTLYRKRLRESLKRNPKPTIRSIIAKPSYLSFLVLNHVSDQNQRNIDSKLGLPKAVKTKPVVGTPRSRQ